jgi:hypothetical protein
MVGVLVAERVELGDRALDDAGVPRVLAHEHAVPAAGREADAADDHDSAAFVGWC